MDLNSAWFLLIFVLLAGYAILDGFDLGVGALHLVIPRGDRERRIAINAIGPVWDGNEVWLLAGGGALFAAFPPVYATVFSGFYLALMLLLFALIARAVSMEFRGKVESARWARVWDYAFGIGSLVPAVLLGVALGNVLRGVPLGPDGSWNGSFIGLLNPYAILVGVLTLAVFVLHGAIYLAMKTEGELQERVARPLVPLWRVVLGLYAVTTLATAWTSPWLLAGLAGMPLFWLMLVLMLAGLLSIPRAACGCHRQYGRAFIASSLMIGGMVGLAAVALFPRLLPALSDAGQSLTIYNSASTPRTLRTMLFIALIGMPFVIAYTVIIYRAFRGKVVLAEDSY